MNSLNQMIIEGNIVHLQDKVSTANGFTVKPFSIAVNREYHNAEGEVVSEASYFDVDAFGNLAESIEKWGERGRGVRIVGRLKQERWTDDEGKTHSRVKIIAEHIEFKPKKPEAQGEKVEAVYGQNGNG